MSYEYERAVAAGDALRLHLNENTAGCSPGVIAALQRLTRQNVAIYPDYETVVAACAARLGVQPECLLLTNGLDDGILAAAVSALRNSPLEEPFEAIVVVPAFDMYAACADAVGGRVVEVPLGPEFVFPVREVIQAVTTANAGDLPHEPEQSHRRTDPASGRREHRACRLEGAGVRRRGVRGLFRDRH